MGMGGYRKEMDSVWVTSAINALRALALVCDIITFPVYLVLQRPWKRRQLAKRVKAVRIKQPDPSVSITIEEDNIKENAKPIKQDSTSITYRSLQVPSAEHIRLLREGVDTLEKMLKFVVKLHGTKRCLGTREILGEEDEVQENGRIFKKYNMGEYKWKNFIEVDKLASYFGRGLRELGQKPRENIAIFAETRAEWMIAAHGCFKHSIPIVTIYATLGDEAIAHGINETEVTTVITTHDLIPKFRNILKMCPKINTLIYMEDQLRKTDTTNYKENVQLLSFTEVVKKGSESSIEGVPPTAEDICIIMYTSGSTGVPKGVLLNHNNLISTMKCFCDEFEIFPNDVLLGFLPLAHVFELLAESVCLLTGVPIGYSTALTMIDSSSKIKKGTKGDASVLHPTCITSVPLILDRISKGVSEKVSNQKPFARALFNFAYDYKTKWTRRGYSTPLIDKVIFSKVASLLGGHVRVVLSGGAPLSPDTHELIKNCLCVSVIQGYGLTETTSSATIMDKYDMSFGRAGVPSTMTDIKLINWEEGNYRVTNKPYPQGEVILGGDSVSQGYYKLPEKTQEEFYEEDGKRWFKTGDIGEFHHDGVLKIIDRKKDLVKLQAGEYVSLGKVEAELKTCPVVENICVYGDSFKHYTVALVVPNHKQLQDLALKTGVEGGENMELEELCTSPKVEKAVIKELAEHGKKCKLEKFEVPLAIKLVSEVWSPDMGLVTAAFKLKRKDIQERYQNDINRMYAS